MGYNVVFKTKVGSSQGVVTWSGYKNKQHFDQWYDDEMRATYEVIFEGVSEEEAVRQSVATPYAVRLRAALNGAADPRTGDINPDILAMELGNLRFLYLLLIHKLVIELIPLLAHRGIHQSALLRRLLPRKL